MGVTPRLLTYLVYHIFSGVASWLCCGLLAPVVSVLFPDGSMDFLRLAWLPPHSCEPPPHIGKDMLSI